MGIFFLKLFFIVSLFSIFDLLSLSLTLLLSLSLSWWFLAFFLTLFYHFISLDQAHNLKFSPIPKPSTSLFDLVPKADGYLQEMGCGFCKAVDGLRGEWQSYGWVMGFVNCRWWLFEIGCGFIKRWWVMGFVSGSGGWLFC